MFSQFPTFRWGFPSAFPTIPVPFLCVPDLTLHLRRETPPILSIQFYTRVNLWSGGAFSFFLWKVQLHRRLHVSRFWNTRNSILFYDKFENRTLQSAIKTCEIIWFVDFSHSDSKCIHAKPATVCNKCNKTFHKKPSMGILLAYVISLPARVEWDSLGGKIGVNKCRLKDFGLTCLDRLRYERVGMRVLP